MIDALPRLLAAMRRRARLADTVVAVERVALPAALAIAALAVAASRLLGGDVRWAFLALLPLPLTLAWAWWRPRSDRRLARRADAHYDLHDRLGIALELAAHPPREPLAARLDPAAVIPLHVPRPGRPTWFAAAALVGAMLLPEHLLQAEGDAGDHPSETISAVASEGRRGVPLDLSRAEPVRRELASLTREDDEPARAAQATLEILDALERGELDRAEALARLDALDQALARAEEAFAEETEEDPEVLAEGVRALAEALDAHELTQEAARAMESGDPEAAERAMDQAGDTEDASGQAELDAAMAAAERALAKAARRGDQTTRALEKAERRLRRDKARKDEREDPAERERRLKRQQRRVEELRRQHEREQAARRRLEQLRRQAEQARRRGASRSRKQQARRKLGRGAGQAGRTARRWQRLSRSRGGVQEARNFVRRAGQKGKGRDRRTAQARRFAKAAKGKRGKGKGKEGKSTLMVEGQVDGEPDGMMSGESNQPGPEGDGDGQGAQSGEGDGSGPAMDGGAGGDQPGEGIGRGTQDALGDPSALDARAKNVRVDPKHGRGATRSEVIRTSSQQGFATEAYRDVYQDYRAFAQSALDGDDLPLARRRTVRRYFQLIQPRNP